MNVLRSMILGSGLALMSSQALAFVDGQLLVGQRYGEFKEGGDKSSVTATEVTVAGHVSPLPIVGFGLYLTNHDYDVNEDDELLAFDELKGYQAGAEVTATVPFDIADLGLYGKAGYSFYGLYTGKSSDVIFTGVTEGVDVEGDFKVSGYKLAVGLSWNPIAIVSALLEFNYGAETWEADEFKLDGNTVEVEDSEDTDLTYTSILVGVQAGI